TSPESKLLTEYNWLESPWPWLVAVPIAVALGLLAGVLLGVGVAVGLQRLLTAFAIELPDADLVLSARTAVVGLGVGVGVTVLSALAPAVKALRVPPVAAIAPVPVSTTPRGRRVRTVVGLLLAAAGVAALGFGLFVDAGMPTVIGGALALLLGAALLARYAVRPLLAVLGWPVTRLGIRGSLAQENVVRNPQRTASTASALMIGLGLVTFALIFGASLRESFESTVERQFASDLQIRSENFEPLPSRVQDGIERLPQVASVADMRLGQVGVDGRVVAAAAVEPDKLGTAWNLEVVDGALDRFADGGVVVADDAAAQIGVSAGDTLDVTFPQTGVQPLTVQAIVDNETASYYIDEATFLDNASDEGPLTLYVTLLDGVTVAEARPAIEAVTGDYTAVGVQDAEDMRQEISDQVNQALGLMSALLGLSILIAVFGIANTLSLSVFERVREFGLLRAVGATRAQIRSVVRWESVLIAVLGALFGIGVGTIFGWMSVRALAEDGFTVFAFPTTQVLLGVLAAAVAGMLSAVLPARRAAQVDMLRAVAST
ncbi:MAG TPA: FtsX-like permease family protein, partial [Euzebyales bacterium]|nr:FtsX-like permease family protein [Euzebyales bacterium]